MSTIMGNIEGTEKYRTAICDADGKLIVNSDITDGIAIDIEGGGVVSIGTTAVEITFTGTTKNILLTADTSNTGTLYIGKSDVTSAGANAFTFLESGEATMLAYNDVTNPLYVVASEASQNVWKGATLS